MKEWLLINKEQSLQRLPLLNLSASSWIRSFVYPPTCLYPYHSKHPSESIVQNVITYRDESHVFIKNAPTLSDSILHGGLSERIGAVLLIFLVCFRTRKSQVACGHAILISIESY